MTFREQLHYRVKSNNRKHFVNLSIVFILNILFQVHQTYKSYSHTSNNSESQLRIRSLQVCVNSQRERATVSPPPSLHTGVIFSAPSSSRSQDARLLLLNHKHGFWSSSGQNFKLMIVAKIPVYSEKSTCQNKYKSQSEGTTKAQKSLWLLGSWSIYYIFFGMHRWKNSWGWHNKYNKYCSKNNIYCCRKLLSALLFSQRYCAFARSKGIRRSKGHRLEHQWRWPPVNHPHPLTDGVTLWLDIVVLQKRCVSAN